MEKVWYQSYPEGMPKTINPEEYQSLGDFLEKMCLKYGPRKAVTNLGTSLTYTALEEKSAIFASYLQNELRLRKGERIALMLPNCLQYYVALFGALRAGLIVVNINPLYTQRELVYQLEDSGANDCGDGEFCTHGGGVFGSGAFKEYYCDAVRGSLWISKEGNCQLGREAYKETGSQLQTASGCGL